MYLDVLCKELRIAKTLADVLANGALEVYV